MAIKVSGLVRVTVAGLLIAGLAAPVMAQRVRDGRSRTSVDSRDNRNDDDDRAPKETEQVDRTISIPANGTLRLKNFSGNVRIVAGSGRDVVMKATRRASRERLDRIKLDVSTSGSTVTIEANKQLDPNRRNNNVVDTTFELQVPASIDLDVQVFSSDVTVEGVTGEQKIHSFSGEIDVRNPRGAVDAETFSADIRVTVPRDARGSVSFSTFSGEVDTTLAISSTSWRKRNVEGTLPGGAGPRMKFQTFSGDLKISSR